MIATFITLLWRPVAGLAGAYFVLYRAYFCLFESYSGLFGGLFRRVEALDLHLRFAVKNDKNILATFYPPRKPAFSPLVGEEASQDQAANGSAYSERFDV